MSYFTFLLSNKRWLAGGFLLTFFSSFGQTYFIALSTGHIRQTYDLTSGEYGSIFMLATLGSAMLLPFLGQIVDHLSIAKTVILTAVMLGLACFSMAWSGSVMVLFFTLFALRLFGQGMMVHISFTAMGRWYAENRGKAVSVASLGFNFGQAIFPISFVALMGLVGWRNGWLIVAIVTIIVALPSIVLLLRVERVPRGSEKDNWDDTIRQWTRNEMLRDPLFWLTTCGVLSTPFISTAIFFHQDYLLALRGWSADVFALSFVWMTVISITSGLLAGVVVDKTSANDILPWFVVPLGLGCFSLAFIESQLAMVLFMSLLGVSMGIVTAIFGSLWPELYGTRHLGAIRSVVMALMVLFSALGPGVIGWFIDFGVPYSAQLFAMGLYCMTASLVLFYTSRKFKIRNRAYAGKPVLS